MCAVYEKSVGNFLTVSVILATSLSISSANIREDPRRRSSPRADSLLWMWVPFVYNHKLVTPLGVFTGKGVSWLRPRCTQRPGFVVSMRRDPRSLCQQKKRGTFVLIRHLYTRATYTRRQYFKTLRRQRENGYVLGIEKAVKFKDGILPETIGNVRFFEKPPIDKVPVFRPEG